MYARGEDWICKCNKLKQQWYLLRTHRIFAGKRPWHQTKQQLCQKSDFDNNDTMINHALHKRAHQSTFISLMLPGKLRREPTAAKGSLSSSIEAKDVASMSGWKYTDDDLSRNFSTFPTEKDHFVNYTNYFLPSLWFASVVSEPVRLSRFVGPKFLYKICEECNPSQH